MIRKREPHWQSAAERARVAAELIEEAESLTKTGGIASPAEVDRDKLPPPLRLEVPPPPPPPPANDADSAAPPPVAAPVAEPPAPAPAPVPAARAAAARGDRDGALAVLDAALDTAPDDAALLVERALTLAAGGRYAAAQRDLERVLHNDPTQAIALTALAWFVVPIVIGAAVTLL